MRKEYVLTIPSMRLITKNKEVYDTTKGILDNELMLSVFQTLMFKITQDPNVLSLKKSQDGIKISKTIKGLEAIANILGDMQEEQMVVRKQLSESIEYSKYLSEKMKTFGEHNMLQSSTLKDMKEILSSSAEGIEMLNKITERSKLSIDEMIANEPVDTKFIAEVSEKVTELEESQLVFSSYPTNAVDMDDEDDDDDDEDGGFSAEELAKIVKTFKSE